MLVLAGFQVAYLVTRDIDGNLLLDTEDVHKKISTAKLVVKTTLVVLVALAILGLLDNSPLCVALSCGAMPWTAAFMSIWSGGHGTEHESTVVGPDGQKHTAVFQLNRGAKFGLVLDAVFLVVGCYFGGAPALVVRAASMGAILFQIRTDVHRRITAIRPAGLIPVLVYERSAQGNIYETLLTVPGALIIAHFHGRKVVLQAPNGDEQYVCGNEALSGWISEEGAGNVATALKDQEARLGTQAVDDHNATRQLATASIIPPQIALEMTASVPADMDTVLPKAQRVRSYGMGLDKKFKAALT